MTGLVLLTIQKSGNIQSITYLIQEIELNKLNYSFDRFVDCFGGASE